MPRMPGAAGCALGKADNDLAILTRLPIRIKRIGMRRRPSTSTKSSPSAGPDALIALVRLLARQAACELVVQGPASSDNKHTTGGLAND
jgi:hypothetical protein